MLGVSTEHRWETEDRMREQSRDSEAVYIMAMCLDQLWCRPNGQNIQHELRSLRDMLDILIARREVLIDDKEIPDALCRFTREPDRRRIMEWLKEGQDRSWRQSE